MKLFPCRLICILLQIVCVGGWVEENLMSAHWGGGGGGVQFIKSAEKGGGGKNFEKFADIICEQYP